MTLYLWDLADTLFIEEWNQDKSGFLSYNDYVASRGYDLGTISPLEYELCYEEAFRKKFFTLGLKDGFVETLAWTRHNVAFSTGNREQIDWRAEMLLPEIGFDIRTFLPEVLSTFDYGNVNKKAVAMFADIIRKKISAGYTTLVYADDKLSNCELFLTAARQHPEVSSRVYHMTGSAPAPSHSPSIPVKNLLELLHNEQLTFHSGE